MALEDPWSQNDIDRVRKELEAMGWEFIDVLDSGIVLMAKKMCPPDGDPIKVIAELPAPVKGPDS